MAQLPTYETEYYEPYTSQPPCKNCECQNNSPQAIYGDKYFPNILNRPIPTKIFNEEKPKKSFWQQLFGIRKCSFCSKKKQDSICKDKKKQKYLPKCRNPGQFQVDQLECQPNNPSCRCKSNSFSCPRRCIPTPQSICGCHFYFNIENRKKNLGYNIREEPVRDTGPDIRISPSPDKKKGSCSPCETKRHSTDSKTRGKKKSSLDYIHVGVTLTQEETKFFRPNGNIHPIEDEEHSVNEDSNRVLTIELKKNYDEINQHANKYKNENHISFANDISPNSSIPQSESFSREILPLLLKKRRGSRPSIHKDEIPGEGRHGKRPKTSSIHLDRRFSEILQRLHNIEEKINKIQKKRMENKDIRIDFDNQNSTVSVQIRDSCSNKLVDTIQSSDSHSGDRKADANIEIRHTRSRSYSPVRKHSLQTNELRNTKSLNDCKKIKHSKQKIIIKIPDNNNNYHCIEVPNNSGTPFDNTSYRRITWCEVSNQLKEKPPEKKCYCYDCMCKRNGTSK